jgi:N-formylglutamate amidohydrolase
LSAFIHPHSILPGPIVRPNRGTLPILLSVPHSGRQYPGWLVDLARSGKPSLQHLEDPLVDRLVWRAVELGCGTVIARAPRGAIDCNRGEEEIDPSVIADAVARGMGPRARGGLGIVPARTQRDGYLWRRAISRAQLEERLDSAHRPYHQAIAGGLEAIRHRHGVALLLDCHSMPPPRDCAPSIVIGDRHGRTTRPWITSEAMALVQAMGFKARLNDPFAGGHVVDRHGRPGHGVHAIQVEIDRRLYLDESMRAPGPGFDSVARLIAGLAAGLGEALLGRQAAAAAE